MANMERFQTAPIICEGGLDSNQNYLLLSQRAPGSATTLVNHEPSLFGGYRRIDGFEPLEEDYADVDDTGSEGKILGVAIYNSKIIAARKTKSASTYKFFYWTSGADWTAYATGLTHTATNVDKIRYDTFNFDGDEKVIFVDGINPAVLFDGTTWVDIDTADSGADYANAGGAMAVNDPKYVSLFKNHVFIAGSAADPHVIAHSAPLAEYDWTAASGAGQLNAGFEVVQIKPFRDELFVFGETKIKKIVVEGSDFVLKDVTINIGCLAADSVVEINGDLVFLSQDGFRTIAATERNNDVELGVLSKSIQQDVTDLINSADLSQVNAVVIKKKSQVRFFFSDENLTVNQNVGILGGLKAAQDGVAWEWSRLIGIRTSCTTSGYIANQEYVLHGDYNGKIYRQELGNSFDGANILAVYTMPYLDFGDIYIRKTIHKVTVFLRPEGEVSLSALLQFDWDSDEVLNPSSYLLEDDVTGSLYDVGIYDTAMYAGVTSPVLIKNVEGSGFSTRFTFTSNDMRDSYSIQAVVFEYAVNGRK